jgi:hypothetical protein
VPKAAVISEITCTFDLTKVIMIYSRTKARLTTPGPGTESTVPDFPLVI